MTPRTAFWVGASAGALAFLGVLPQSLSPTWLINESASAPKGLYRRSNSPITLGALVAVRPPETARPYLATLGFPPRMPLLKRIAALGGETICRKAGTLRWPRGTVAVARRDRRGVALPQWAGCRRLAPEEVLLVGDTPTSFDSRYFGPVRRTALEGVYVEVIRW